MLIYINCQICIDKRDVILLFRNYFLHETVQLEIIYVAYLCVCNFGAIIFIDAMYTSHIDSVCERVLGLNGPAINISVYIYIEMFPRDSVKRKIG